MATVLLRTLLLVSLCVSAYLQNPSCTCPAVYDPVYRHDRMTYSSRCTASCRYMPVRCEGEYPCTQNTYICGFIYAPVCGWNGITYPNLCTARCSDRRYMAEILPIRSKTLSNQSIISVGSINIGKGHAHWIDVSEDEPSGWKTFLTNPKKMFINHYTLIIFICFI